MKFAIRVVDDDGRPMAGLWVRVEYVGGPHETKYTDSEGLASFEQHKKYATCDLYINDEEGYGWLTLKDGETFQYTYDPDEK
jgi:hypothetical protein